MSKIVFFCIPAFGHTNPTVALVRELKERGNDVRYYSFAPFQKVLAEAGAEVVLCDKYLPPAPEDLDKKLGRDFAALIEMVTYTTLSMDKEICAQLREFAPDVIVSDSMCFWGKLFAKKLGIPYICSTTTFAFNDKSARLIKRSGAEMISAIFGMSRVNAQMKLLSQNGYKTDSLLDIIQNDNSTDTIVYTSKFFQPLSETFTPQHYAFVGPSINAEDCAVASSGKKRLYISLGTVMNKRANFYRRCLEAFGEGEFEVTMSVGEGFDIASLGAIPENFTVQNKVEQLKVLQNTEVFITHCGMNSVSEAMYFCVPCVLFPQQSEERAVAERVSELGAGVLLKKDSPLLLRSAVSEALRGGRCRSAAEKIAESFRSSGGYAAAADFVLKKCNIK